MKKMCVSIIVLIILLSFNVSLEAATPNGSIVKVYDDEPKINYEVENKKREKATEKALSTLLEKYKTEEVSDKERILEYSWNGYGLRKIEDETKEFNCVIHFDVIPYLDENSVWDASREMCFAEFNRIDGELVLKNISLKPEIYEEFMESFEEYEKNKESGVEVTGVQADVSYVTSENKIDELSNIIFIGSAIVLVIVVVTIIIFKVKKKK